jgi:hypothetical protein
MYTLAGTDLNTDVAPRCTSSPLAALSKGAQGGNTACKQASARHTCARGGVQRAQRRKSQPGRSTRTVWKKATGIHDDDSRHCPCHPKTMPTTHIHTHITDSRVPTTVPSQGGCVRTRPHWHSLYLVQHSGSTHPGLPLYATRAARNKSTQSNKEVVLTAWWGGRTTQHATHVRKIPPAFRDETGPTPAQHYKRETDNACPQGPTAGRAPSYTAESPPEPTYADEDFGRNSILPCASSSASCCSGHGRWCHGGCHGGRALQQSPYNASALK